MDYRLLEKTEAQDYQKIRLESLQNNPEAFASTYEREAVFTLEKIESRVARTNNSFLLGAFDEENLVGIVGFIKETSKKIQHKGFIYGMYVTPDYRGKGIAKELMVRVVQHAKETFDDLEIITLSIVTNNVEARGLYLSLGFEIYGYEKHALKLDDQYYDEELMSLAIKDFSKKTDR